MKSPSELWVSLLSLGSLLKQAHHQATVTWLNMGDFIPAFPFEDCSGDSLPIEEVGC